MEEVTLALDCKNTLGEGILWNEEESCLYWTDIEGRILYKHDPGNQKTATYPMPERLCSFAFRRGGGFLMAFESGISRYELSSGKMEWLVKLRKPEEQVRLNDGRCDRNGRFVVGEFDPEEKNRGKAYLFDGLGVCRELFGGLNSANSTCFSPDGTVLYYSCAVAGEIWAYDYDQVTGIPSNRRLFHSFQNQPGLPDGSAVDAEGFLWNAQWAGSRIVRFSPDGKVDRVVEVPVKNVTCLCFGGEELNKLYITTARMTLDDTDLFAMPTSGGLFVYEPGVRGIPESQFDG